MLLATCLAWGCATATAPTRGRPTVTTPDIATRGGKLDLAVIPRPTADALLLSLWLDAGARDASVPQLATVSARLAARAIGPGAGGVAHPDGIELTMPCSRPQLDTCLTALRRGLSLRDVDVEQLASVLRELADGRRRRLASDPGAGADALSLRAATGDAAGGLQPLGDPAQDGAVTADAVAAFLADHFGGSRGLLVAAGNLALPELRAAAARVDGTPRAQAQRAQRGLPAAGAPGVLVAPDTADHSSIAVVGGSVASVLATAALLQSELDGDGGITSHVAPVRGGAVGLLRLGTADPARLARTLAWVAATRGQLPTPVAGGTRLDGVWEASRGLGLRWTAGGNDGEGGDSDDVAVGLGVTRRSRSADGSARRDRGAERAEALQGTLAAQLEATAPQRVSSGAVASSDARVSATLDGGVRLEIAQESGPMAGIALRFTGGPALEPPTAHGRSAMLAELAARHCDGMASDALRARLRPLGAHMSAHVDAEGWGIGMQVPPQHLHAGLRLAFRCALSPSVRAADVADVAATLRDRLGRGTEARMRAATAQALSPGAPGIVMLGGAPSSLPSLGTVEMQRARAEAVVGRRMQVAVVAPLPASRLADWIALRLAAVPAGDAASPATTPRGEITIEPADGAEQLVLWQGGPGPGAGAGARSFARMAAQVLADGGLAAVWHGGGADTHGSWAAVGVQPGEAQRPLVAALVADAFAGASAVELPRAVATSRAREALEGQRTASAGSAAARAMALLVGPETAAESACVEVAANLWRSTPTVHRVP